MGSERVEKESVGRKRKRNNPKLTNRPYVITRLLEVERSLQVICEDSTER